MKFAQLDATEKRLVLRLADEAGTLTPFVTASASHIGELWEAAAFFRHFPKGTAPHEELASRLKSGCAANESIFDAIKRIAPDYVTIGESGDAELDGLLSWLKSVFPVQ